MKHGFHKDRTRGWPLVRSLLFLLILSTAWYFCSVIDFSFEDRAGSDISRELVDAVEPALEPPPMPSERLVSYVIRPGDSFVSILGSFGVSTGDAINYFTYLKKVGLASLVPGDSMVFAIGPDEGVKSFSLLSRLSHWYNISRAGERLLARRTPRPRTRYRHVVKGTLQSTLSEDMQRYGQGEELVGKLAEIFAWDINFFVDPRKGDRFEVLFEKYYREGEEVGYGEVLAARYTNRGNHYVAFGMRDSNGVMNYYDAQGKSLQKQFLRAPLRFRRISSGFSHNRKHPILGIVRPHYGIDYAAPVGTPVHAAADGTVLFTGVKNGYGRLIILEHGGVYQTYYGHLHSIRRTLRKGMEVKQGDLIGTVGATGLATGPHLDYRLRRNGKFVNPLTIKLPSKKGVTAERMDRFRAIKYACRALLETRFPEDGSYVVDVHPINEPEREQIFTVESDNNDNSGDSEDNS